jgi:hypothetical protein
MSKGRLVVWHRSIGRITVIRLQGTKQSLVPLNFDGIVLEGFGVIAIVVISLAGKKYRAES